MNSTFEITSRATGKQIRFEAEYVCKMVDRYLDADGYKVKASKQEESTVGSMLRVFVDGKEVDSCWNPSFWGLIDVKGKKKIWGLKIGFADQADAQAYESWINNVIEAGTDDSVVAARAEKKQAELEAQKAHARRIVAKAEAQADIPEKAEAVRRMDAYNNAVNEGGEGYVPYIYSREEYESALALLAEDEAEPDDAPRLWYAYQTDADDIDWGTGTYGPEEAHAWLEANPAGRIAVIEEGPDPICVDEWEGDDFVR